jgi:hypothetical protein
MGWAETRASVIAACSSRLQPHGYKFVKSRDGFEKAAGDRWGFYLGLVASRYGTYSMKPWCGVRNAAIEEVFHRTSGVDGKWQATYTTINLGAGVRWPLDTAEEVAAAIEEVRRYVAGTALPFLEREYSYQDYSDLLNAAPTQWDCPYHGNPQNCCHYGLIAAKLAGDPRYERLRAVYAEYLRSTHDGFYYPRFEDLLKDLES